MGEVRLVLLRTLEFVCVPMLFDDLTMCAGLYARVEVDDAVKLLKNLTPDAAFFWQV